MAFQWFLVAILAKTSRDEWVGQLSIAFAITSPLILLFNLQIRVSFVADSDSEIFLKYYSTLHALMLVIYLLLILLISTLSPYESTTKIAIIIFGFSKLIESCSEIPFAIFQKNGNLNLIAKSQVLKGFFPAITLITISLITNNFLWGSILYLISYLLILIFYDIRNLKNLFFSQYHEVVSLFRLEILSNIINDKMYRYKIKSLFSTLLPLGVISMLTSYVINIPRFFVEKYNGLVELGIYSSIGYILTAICYIALAVGNVTLPLMSLYVKELNYSSLRILIIKISFFIILVSFTGIILCFYFGTYLLSLLYSPLYAQYSNVLLSMMFVVPFAFCNLFIFNWLLVLKVTGVQLWIYILQIVILIVLSQKFVKDFGVVGAVYAQIGSYIVQFFLSVMLLLKFHRKYFKNYSL